MLNVLDDDNCFISCLINGPGALASFYLCGSCELYSGKLINIHHWRFSVKLGKLMSGMSCVWGQGDGLNGFGNTLLALLSLALKLSKSNIALLLW